MRQGFVHAQPQSRFEIIESKSDISQDSDADSADDSRDESATHSQRRPYLYTKRPRELGGVFPTRHKLRRRASNGSEANYEETQSYDPGAQSSRLRNQYSRRRAIPATNGGIINQHSHSQLESDPPPPYRSQSPVDIHSRRPSSYIAPRDQLPSNPNQSPDYRSNIQGNQASLPTPKITSNIATNTGNIIDPDFEYFIPNKKEKKEYQDEILKNEQKIEELRENRPSKWLIATFLTMFILLAIGLVNPYGPQGFTALQSLQNNIGGVMMEAHSLAFGFATFGMILPLIIGISLFAKRCVVNNKISTLKTNNKISNEILSGKVQVKTNEQSNFKNSQTEIIKKARLNLENKIEAHKLSKSPFDWIYK